MIVQSLMNLQKDRLKKEKTHKKAHLDQIKLRVIQAQKKHNQKAYRMRQLKNKTI
jgi:undecaprenyl pyrophosphate synthase